MALSTTVMPCNFTGMYDFDTYPALAKFGLVDYDWSNAKQEWVNESPMRCEATLVEQAARTKALNPRSKVFVYRNIVKALPWYAEIRALLADQRFWGWFLPYKGCYDNATRTYTCGANATANLYHDHEQTPGWPGGRSSKIDGICHNHTVPPYDAGCDCGRADGILCGEYLFDHRNASLRAWLTTQYMGGAEYGLGNVNVDGFYLDDDWSAAGPSEEDGDCVEKMGLSKADVANLVTAWEGNMAACQAAIVQRGGFNWQLFESISAPSKGKECSAFLREAATTTSRFQTRAMRLELGYAFNKDFSGGALTHFDLDLGIFLAARGNYSWLGYGWMGCGCGWEHNGVMPCNIYDRPAALDVDYGVPIGRVKETKQGSGIFHREWTKATVRVDCNAYDATITMKKR